MRKRLALAAAPLAAAIAACLALLAPAASSQSVPNGQITQGEVWNVDQWNQAWESKQDLLGYKPVQQGGGTGQGANKLYLGWSASQNGLSLQVDGTNYGLNWPINAQSAGVLAPGAHISVGGDVTTAAGVNFTGASDITLSVSLPIVNASPGGCGDASHVPVLTLDSKGRATGCTPTALGAASSATTAGALSPGATISVSGDVSTASGVTFTGASGITLPVTLATVNSNTGACGDASDFAVPTFNAKGLATGCTTHTAVNSFNTRTGAVTLSSADVTGALGYTPANPSTGTVYTLASYTVSTLPAAGTKGRLAIVTDANAACAYNATPAGGGMNVCKVWDNGTAWIEG